MSLFPREGEREVFGYNPAFAKMVYRKRLEGKGTSRREERLREQENRWRELGEIAEKHKRAEQEYKDALVNSLREGSPADLVIAKACRVFGVLPSELKARDRTARVAFARNFCYYWVRRRTDMSLCEIGMKFGRRNHKTIIDCKRLYVAKRAKMGRTLRQVL